MVSKEASDLDLFWVEFIMRDLNLKVLEINSSLDALHLSISILNSKLDTVLASHCVSQTNNRENSAYMSNTPTSLSPINPLGVEISTLSIGNKGVPADRQTDRQTDKEEVRIPNFNSLSDTDQLLISFNSLKKELIAKFKQFTEQEFLVFSTIYQFGAESLSCDYPALAKRLSLTESSVRDYVAKLLKKGAPIIKHKQKNKSISLEILPSFQKITPLSVILSLREL